MKLNQVAIDRNILVVRSDYEIIIECLIWHTVSDEVCGTQIVRRNAMNVKCVCRLY